MDTNNIKERHQLLLRTIAIWKFLVKRWWVYLLCGCIGGIAGIVYASVQPSKYQSTLTFALEDNASGINGALSLAAEFGLSIGGGKDIFSGENILAILSSRRIIESVLLSVDTVNGKARRLIESYLEMTQKLEGYKNHPRLSGLSYNPEIPKSKFSYLQDSILYATYNEIVKDGLSVTRPDRKLNIYKVEFTASNERFCKMFTERVVDEANRYYVELRSKKAFQTLQVLEARVATLKGSAKSSIQSKSSVQDANLNPVLSAQNAALQSANIDISAYSAAYGELFKNLEIARYQYLKEMPLMQIIDAPHYPMKNLKKGRLRTGVLVGFLGGFLSIVGVLGWFFVNEIRREMATVA